MRTSCCIRLPGRGGLSKLEFSNALAANEHGVKCKEIKMCLDKFLSIFVTIMGFIGSLLLLKGVLAITTGVMAEIGQTRLDYSIPSINNLATQKADVIIGVFFIICAFLVQLLTQVVDLSQITISGGNLWNILKLLAFVLIISLIMWPINNALSKHYR